MALFDQNFKDEVRAKNDIVEVISSYVKLERRGNRYVGLCPFHGEKTPSFHVIPQMQIYHCFGCKASGDVFKFVQEREHMSFYEALVHLARRARIALPQEERTPEEEKAYRERRALYEALEFAGRFFHHQLLSESGKPGRDYLLSRGLTEETIRHFRLGWAPGYGQLWKAMRGRFDPEVLQKAGLIMPRREGSGYMDAFYDRVMFPITDLTGRIIGFGGRILEGNGPKYKNTADTPLFSKRHVLFGLAQAKEAMRTRNQAILVEGYMDVIMPHQVGIKNVVAPLGTALTDEQCKLIRQQAEQVIVAFDADTAGQLATIRGLEKLYEIGCDVRVLRVPDGKDPDEYIRAHGPEGFQRCIDEAIHLIEFKLRLALSRHPEKTPEAKARALEAVARVLADVKNDLLREEYVRKVVVELARGEQVDERELKLAIDRQMNRLLRSGYQQEQPVGQSYPSSQPNRQGFQQDPSNRQGFRYNQSNRQGFQHNQPNSRNNIRDSGFNRQAGSGSYLADLPQADPGARSRRVTEADLVWRAERTLIFLLLQYPSLISRVEAELGTSPFSDPVHSTIYQAVAGACSEKGAAGGSVVARLLDTLLDSDARLAVSEMAATPLVTVNPEQEAADCIEKIQEHRDSRRIADLENLIKAKEAAGERVEDAVIRELMQLQLKRKKSSKS